jgi:hypothetical protein
MPIIFFPNTQQQILARGERLGFCKKLLLAIGVPVDVQSAFSEDVYTITKHHPPVLQLTDEEARRRSEANAKRQEEERKHNPNPGAKPKVWTPRG